MTNNILLFILAVLLPSVAFAVDLDAVVDLIPSSTGQWALVVGGLLELVLRFTKTRKPVSILRLISRSAKKLAEGLVKVAEFIDAVLPQRVEGQPVVGGKQKHD